MLYLWNVIYLLVYFIPYFRCWIFGSNVNQLTIQFIWDKLQKKKNYSHTQEKNGLKINEKYRSLRSNKKKPFRLRKNFVSQFSVGQIVFQWERILFFWYQDLRLWLVFFWKFPFGKRKGVHVFEMRASTE